ncbi:MAG: Gx transporter family protein [Zetaproteobacteria bacterium]|nr:Gx transporter family protein [Zetaproteobacteria bacterium]
MITPPSPLQHNKPSQIQLRQHAQWLLFLIFAITINMVEASLPSLGPWFKPGLANIITLLVLFIWGAKAALILATARVIVSALLIGTLFTPTFIIAISATLSSTLVMVIFYMLIPKPKTITISLLGATVHITVQFIVVETLFIQQHALYYLLPPLLFLACITGWLNGAIAAYTLKHFSLRGLNNQL